MALFQPFPNYIWNLSVAIAMENGGRIGEIVDMIEPLLAKAQSGADAGTGLVAAAGLAAAYVDLPCPRNLSELVGDIEHALSGPARPGLH